MVTLITNDISSEEYLYLREKVGWVKLSSRQTKQAIEKSLFIVKAIDDEGNVIGMGRIVGDGAVICYIQDLVVIPEAQGKGVGSLIIDKLISYVRSIKEDGTTMMLCLMCAKGREKFYEKHDFMARPTDSLGPGMIQYL
ncbi:MAG: GNAT family N-acetyltransferase [Lachnospiraceae bacterium]|nr:GNAT family N-acetyltransferase [Lachnospiraceae bacterium]